MVPLPQPIPHLPLTFLTRPSPTWNGSSHAIICVHNIYQCFPQRGRGVLPPFQLAMSFDVVSGCFDLCILLSHTGENTDKCYREGLTMTAPHVRSVWLLWTLSFSEFMKNALENVIPYSRYSSRNHKCMFYRTYLRV